MNSVSAGSWNGGKVWLQSPSATVRQRSLDEGELSTEIIKEGVARGTPSRGPGDPLYSITPERAMPHRWATPCRIQPRIQPPISRTISHTVTDLHCKRHGAYLRVLPREPHALRGKKATQ
ncbi:hypothetical protein AAFF_G00274020 [Aldrovandia affinis]|uniref:Uncharacterized protein n=1 Tax=Aldrovandia affinis TaxID=143900 RepID=A0AAD7SRZ4_9TELE|nr:hypothetical protein AAFF_G00274020 [Aldrovandia affinis]